MLTKALQDEIVSRTVGAINPLKIILFGSYAYSEPVEGSDLDLLERGRVGIQDRQ